MMYLSDHLADKGFARATRVAVVLLLTAGLAGCSAAGARQSAGGIVGAFAGPQTGSAPGAAAIAEAMGGGLIAGDIGAQLRREDRRRGLEAEYRALEYAAVGQPVVWTGANDRFTGRVVAAAPYRVGSQDCRQYIHTVEIAGTTNSARGTACRNADGSWSLLV